MQKNTYTYVTYINTTPEKLWNALIDPELTRQYWFNHRNASDWKQGSTWEHRDYDDASDVDICGTVLESKPPHRLVLSWAQPANQGVPEKTSRLTFEIEPMTNSVKLSVIHEDLDPEMGAMISGGWPMVLSSLKTLLETGNAIDLARMNPCPEGQE
jgi:uncharacterized protein YndB with AHSA1/START domain